MLLTCPTCTRSYTIGRTDLGHAGRLVICSGCQTQWFAHGIYVPPAASNDDSRTPFARTAKTPRQLAAGPSFIESKVVPWAGRVAAAAAIVALTIVSITHRDRIVRHMPRTAVLYKAIGLAVNPIGLAFDSVTPRRLASSDVTVAGGIRNVAHRRVAVPRLAFEVRNAAGLPVLSWSEAAPARMLDPGATMAFTSAPHHMPAESAIVTVRFVSDEPKETRPIRTVASAL